MLLSFLTYRYGASRSIRRVTKDRNVGHHGALRCWGYHIPTGKFDGKNFAALSTLTVRLDPGSGTWDVFSSSRLLANNLPLIDAKRNDRRIVFTGGTGGAWISGLIFSDENPLYEDVNNNGIDDAFEKQQRGGTLLPTSASIPERQALAKQWRESQRAKPPRAFVVARPTPDK